MKASFLGTVTAMPTPGLPKVMLHQMTTGSKSISYEQRAIVARLVNLAKIELVEPLDRNLARFSITFAQYVILSTSSTGRTATAVQFCKEIGYTPCAMTRMFDRLEQKGAFAEHLMSKAAVPSSLH
jgi:hypothetical protein